MNVMILNFRNLEYELQNCMCFTSLRQVKLDNSIERQKTTASRQYEDNTQCTLIQPSQFFYSQLYKKIPSSIGWVGVG